ncbi:MAG: LPS export ABC transporter periplasmic protein LptC [Pseudomonadota bacterium]
MNSNEAVFNRIDNVVTLKGDVVLFEDHGYELHSQELLVDLESKEMISHTSVNGFGPLGEMRSEGMKIEKDVIKLTGRSFLRVYP